MVNDFGAINIDAELIAGASEGVVSLANGCICCSLEGDLLRTLAAILRRSPRPEAIVIETSGVADPADIVRNLMDPVIWREVPLGTVLCVVDATAPAEALDDALLRLQDAIGRLAPTLARAKSLFEAVEQPGRQLLSELAGGAATLAPAGAPRARIVFIAEIGFLSTAEIGRIMDGCASAGLG